MLDYFLIFDTRGKILFEMGDAPSFRNKYILNIKFNHLKHSDKIRDLNVFYKISGRTIFLLFSNDTNFNSLEKYIQKYEYDNKKVEKQDFSVSNVQELEEEIKPQPFYMRPFKLFKNEITISELKEKMKIHLINKNVAPSITESFCKAILTDLEGKNKITEQDFKLGLKSTIENLMKSVDHSQLIEKIKEKKKNKQIFTFCFVGLNGVGKSTSLAKVCYWLLQNNLKVFIAACDTFRAGAVEQLKVHFERFKITKKDVGFYDQGYGEHETQVCKDAINTAKKEDYDVVLIDTAGRMHTNNELMLKLKKLIKINNPDHIIFVGEALVGSESLEHLNEFNKAIGNVINRHIDSILVTKVDTVDDKIGQLINMSMAAAAPIIFVGTGQRNMDLMKIDSEKISNVLMS